MFKEEKEIHAAGYVGFDHSELQTAYSLDSVHGFILNGYAGHDGLGRGDLLKSFLFEGGYVYSKKLKNKYKIELIGGYGYGRKEYYEHYARSCWVSFSNNPSHREIWYDFDNRFHRLFAQINWGTAIGKKPKSKSSFAFTLRTVSMLYTKYYLLYEKYNLDISYINPIAKDYADLQYKMAFLIEPGFTLRFSFFDSHPVYFTYLFKVPFFSFGHPIIRKYTYTPNRIYTGLGLEIAFTSKKKKDVTISK